MRWSRAKQLKHRFSARTLRSWVRAKAMLKDHTVHKVGATVNINSLKTSPQCANDWIGNKMGPYVNKISLPLRLLFFLRAWETSVPKSSCKPYPIQSAAVALDPFHPDPAIGTCLPLPSHGGLRSSPRDDFARGRWASGPGMRGERRPGSRWGETRSGVSLGAATPGSSWREAT